MGRSTHCFAAIAGLALLAGCASRPTTVPEPRTAPIPARLPAIAPAPVQPQPSTEWRDMDLSGGAWVYDGTAARFATSDGAAFALRCDSAARRMVLEREGAAGEMTIRTTETERRFADVSSPLPAGDPFLDSIVFSRGRFAVETAGRTMIIPAWPEPARAVEDCRI